MMKFWLRLSMVFCLLASAGYAHAEGFALYEYSARGIALSGAMMARKPDASAVAYNPALLTRLPGTHAMAGLTTVYPRGKMVWEDKSMEDTRLKHSLWHIPHGYFTHQINDDWFFGIGEFTRFGLGFEYPHDWPGRFNIYEVNLQSTSINPNIAWRATDKLSLAAGVEIVYVKLDLKKRSSVDMGVPSAYGGPASFEVDANIQDADAWGIGGNFAMHYQFNDQWAFGAQYRSPVRVHAYGDMQYSYVGYSGPSQIPVPGVGMVSGDAMAQGAYGQAFKDVGADSTVVLPDSVAFGLAWMPIPELSIEVGAIWTHWSTFGSLNIYMPDATNTNLKVARSNKHWRDTWRINAGAEWQALDWLALRVGYAYDEAPMTSKYADYLVPTANRNIYSGGIGIKWDAWTVDLAYAYIHPKRRNYNPAPERGLLESRPSESYTQLFSMSVGYEF